MMDFKKLFLKGIDFEDFLEQADENSRKKIEDIYGKINFNDKLVERINEINKKVKVLVFAESWCPDCIAAVPVLIKMAKTSGVIDYAILPKEGNEELLENYKYDGKPRIPTFIFLDENYRELGNYVEIPAKIKEIYEKGMQADYIVARRNYRNGLYSDMIAEEFLNIIEGR
ncbi:thioredoxin family protein [Thermovenabulum gondwanense]|nr:thioredoxin family protein [Thermovenabulum gondwanense]